MTGDRINRSELMERLEELLRRGISVAVEGHFGSGKSELLREVARLLEPQHGVVRLRGTPRGAHSAYLALGALLGEPAGSPPHPAVVFARMSARLRELSADRPLILLIDDFDFLDPQSKALCSMMLDIPSVTLLLSCARVDGCSDLRGAVNARALERLTLSALTVDEGRAVIERVLGGPVCSSVANSLHAHSRGNARILAMLSAHARENGTVARVDGRWRITTHYAEPFTCGSLRGGLSVLQSRLSAEERAALEILAAAGAIHIDVLVQHCDVRALERLQREGLVEAREGGNTYWLHSKGLAHILRQTLGNARCRELWTAIVEPGMKIRGVRPPGANMVWALQRGIDIDDSALLSGADEALRSYSPRIALELASAVSRPSSESRRFRAEALWFLGDTEGVKQALRAISAAPAGATATATDEPVTGRLVQAILSVGVAGCPEGNADPVAQILHHQRTGNYAAILGVFRGIRTTDSVEARYLLTMLCAEAHAACGDAARARKLDAECGLIRESVRSAVVREVGETAHYRVLFLNGDWRDLSAKLAQNVVKRPGHLLFGEKSTLLLPRMLAKDPQETTSGEQDAGRHPMDIFGWFIGRCSTLLSMAPVDPQGTVSKFKELAGHRNLTGLQGLQLFALGSMVLLQGRNSAENSLMHGFNELDLKRLERCAQSASGLLARQLVLLSDGVLTANPVTLVRAVRMAERQGNAVLCAVAAPLASRAAGRVRQPELQRTAQAYVTGPDETSSLLVETGILTRRESQVVDLAVSRSKNAEIAALLGISPRTAERHLQNAYRKLGVSTRRELRDVLLSEDNAVESDGA